MPTYLDTKVFKPNFEVTHRLHQYICQRGIYVNVELVKHYLDHYKSLAIKAAELCAYNSFNYITNPGSHQQVKEYFMSNYSEEALSPYFYVYDAKKKDYRWSFSAPNLEDFNANYDDIVCKNVVEYNSTSKMASNLSSLLNLVQPDSHVYPKANLLVTNRYSFEKPNIHSMTSDAISGIFYVDGFTLVDFDLKQPEPKLTAYASGKTELLELTNQWGDFYKAMGYLVLGLREMTDDQRSALKRCCNAINYSGGRDRIKKIARGFIDGEKFYYGYKKIIADALTNLSKGDTVKTLFGTVLNSRKVHDNQKIAWAIQGTVADILTYMCEYVLRKADTMGLKGYKSLMAGNEIDDIFSVYYTMHDAPYIMFSNSYFKPEEISALVMDLADKFSFVIDGIVDIGAKPIVLSNG